MTDTLTKPRVSPNLSGRHAPVVALIVFAGVVVVCATVLALLNHAHDIPSWFESIALVAMGAAGGVAIPSRTAR